MENAARGLFRESRDPQGREDVHHRHLRPDFPPRRLHRRIEEGHGERVVPAPVVGHVGDGNFHCPSCSIRNPAELAEAKILEKKIILRALEMGGTCSGEHGIGAGGSYIFPIEHGGGLDVMRAIKRALDPDNRMNPGKMVEPQALFGGSDSA